ncbi:hypothetical protein Tsubulata_009633 [Turnera subulata]|uniref:RING-type E3 ubiquitin transferase n=1 Tax=Turnera subulata TaxID=218843 RepID=A0A9Q0IYC0_9ROSI|nr:hypothetical protein Tsubulata_009633 [Turnera subulata]
MRGSSTEFFKREKFLLNVISPAIRGQSCPICLTSLHDHRRAAVLAVCLHSYCVDCIRRWSGLKRNCPLCNAHFDSWFCRISFSSRNFLTEKLPPPDDGKNAAESVTTEDARRVIRRSREELSVDGRRSRPLPWRRTFGRPGSVASPVIEERKLQWRAR